MRKAPRKLLIIGLDGMPFELLQELGRGGTMPRTWALLQQGRYMPMSVSLPEISAVSWSSFMTGTNAGNHGIFGFVDLEPGSYRFRFPDFRDLGLPTFFDDLGSRKKRSVIINLPSTYPARPIFGVLISGFVSLHLERAVSPATYIPALKKMGYQIDVETAKGKDKKAEFLADLSYILAVRKEAADLLWRSEDWDLFMFTVTETDRLHHFLFDAVADSRHRFHAEAIGFYQELDAVIGDLAGRIAGRDEFSLLMLSDHGFGPIQREIYLNPILRKNRLLDFSEKNPKDLTAILPSAKAFALDPSRIYVHRKGKYPGGQVSRSDYDKVRNDIRDLFAGFRWNGQNVIQGVYCKEELYSGPYLDAAPDIVLLSRPGFDLKGGLEKIDETGLNHFTGMHRHDNAFFYISRPDLTLPEPMTIFSVRQVLNALLDH